MSIDVVSPLRQRMIEDMTARKFSVGTQRVHISSCKRFDAFLQRSPDTATVEDVRRFQLHLAETGTSIPNRNRLMTGLRFLFRLTLRRLDLAAEIYHLREPQKIPQVISPDEARRLLAVANSLRTRLLLSLAYGCGLREKAGYSWHQSVSDESALVRLMMPTCRALNALAPHMNVVLNTNYL